MFMKCDNNALQTLARLLPPAPPSTVKPPPFVSTDDRSVAASAPKGTSSEILPLLHFSSTFDKLGFRRATEFTMLKLFTPLLSATLLTSVDDTHARHHSRRAVLERAAIFAVPPALSLLPCSAAHAAAELTDEQSLIVEAWAVVQRGYVDQQFGGNDWKAIKSEDGLAGVAADLSCSVGAGRRQRADRCSRRARPRARLTGRLSAARRTAGAVGSRLRAR
jgi:hypothetical protein